VAGGDRNHGVVAGHEGQAGKSWGGEGRDCASEIAVDRKCYRPHLALGLPQNQLDVIERIAHGRVGFFFFLQFFLPPFFYCSQRQDSSRDCT